MQTWHGNIRNYLMAILSQWSQAEIPMPPNTTWLGPEII